MLEAYTAILMLDGFLSRALVLLTLIFSFYIWSVVHRQPATRSDALNARVKAWISGLQPEAGTYILAVTLLSFTALASPVHVGWYVAVSSVVVIFLVSMLLARHAYGISFLFFVSSVTFAWVFTIWYGQVFQAFYHVAVPPGGEMDDRIVWGIALGAAALIGFFWLLLFEDKLASRTASGSGLDPGFGSGRAALVRVCIFVYTMYVMVGPLFFAVPLAFLYSGADGPLDSDILWRFYASWESLPSPAEWVRDPSVFSGSVKGSSLAAPIAVALATMAVISRFRLILRAVFSVFNRTLAAPSPQQMLSAFHAMVGYSTALIWTATAWGVARVNLPGMVFAEVAFWGATLATVSGALYYLALRIFSGREDLSSVFYAFISVTAWTAIAAALITVGCFNPFSGYYGEPPAMSQERCR